MDAHDLYVMISGTNTGVGKLIRKVTRYPYNHVSLTLRPELDQWVSFARYHKDSAFVGGFISEDLQRFSAIDKVMPVRIFQIPIGPDVYEKLHSLFQTAGNCQDQYCYNLFDAVAGAFHKHCLIPGCFTCLSFANLILGTDYPSISELSSQLEEFLFYEGEYWELKKWTKPDPKGEYLKKIPISKQFHDTLSLLGKLIRRKKNAKAYVDHLDDLPKVLPVSQEYDN